MDTKDINEFLSSFIIPKKQKPDEDSAQIVDNTSILDDAYRPLESRRAMNRGVKRPAEESKNGTKRHADHRESWDEINDTTTNVGPLTSTVTPLTPTASPLTSTVAPLAFPTSLLTSAVPVTSSESLTSDPAPAPKAKLYQIQPGPHFQRILGESYSSSLPHELLALFQPLYCSLCSTQLNSTIVAKMHYNSKNHIKKLKQYLVDYSERTGEPTCDKVHLLLGLKDEDDDPKYRHCDACDLPLTGKKHALSHYMGRNHQKVISGLRPPSGSGFYDTDGKWTRMTKTPVVGAADNFGKDFSETREDPLRCSVCDVTVTSVPQMEMHRQGKKHLKKMNSMQAATSDRDLSQGYRLEFQSAVFDSELSASDYHSPVSDCQTVWSNCDDFETEDFSAYRTPSGQFYCKSCNLTLNTKELFKSHLNSKKHTRGIDKLNLGETLSSYKTPGGLYYCKYCNVSTNSEIPFKQHLESKKHKKETSRIK